MKGSSPTWGAVLLLSTALSASAITIQNPSFSIGLLDTTGQSVTSFDTGNGVNSSGWYVNGQQVMYSVDYMGNRWVAGEVGRSVDLSQRPENKASYTLQGLTAGDSYVMTFYMIRNSYDNALNRLDISAGDSLRSYGINTNYVNQPVGKTFTFTADSTSTILTFAMYVHNPPPPPPPPTGGGSSLIDPPLDFATPEPTTWTLMGAGLLGLIGYARKRQHS